MLRLAGNREWIVASIISIALMVIVPTAITRLSLNPAIVLLFAIAALSGGFFGELRDTWNTERPFSFTRVFFRAFEWLSLAIAGYIILSVIGASGGISN